jgi:hypothetical protein
MMQRLDSGRTALDMAKQMAISEVDRLRARDSVAVILMGRPKSLLISDFTSDLEMVKEKINNIKAGYGVNELDSSVLMAKQLLDGSVAPSKEILIITDMCGPMLSESVYKKVSGYVRILSAAKSAVANNVAVTNISVFPGGAKESKEVSIKAKISNFSDFDRKNLKVQLYIDGQEVARGNVNVPAKSDTFKSFSHRFDKQGFYSGFVKIVSKEGLLQDNTGYFVARVRKNISVLIINGDFRPGSYKDETFYLERALQTVVDGEVPIYLMVKDLASVEDTPFSGNDVIFLAGVTTVSKRLASRLVHYVKHGGRLFIAPGKHGGNFKTLKAVLPALFYSKPQKHFFNKPLRIGEMDKQHPIFSVFNDNLTGLEQVKIYGHIVPVPDPGLKRQVVAKLSDGTPLLLERRIKEGIVMVLTTTIDRDWTDLPISPGYLPLVQRITRYLSDSLVRRKFKKLYVGDHVSIAVEKGMQRLVVMHPDKKETVFSANEIVGKSTIMFKKTFRPGVYHVWGDMPGFGGFSELAASGFVVALNPDESDLNRYNPEKLGIKQDDEGLFDNVAGKLPVWPYLLLAGTLFLIAETIFAGYGLRRSHVKT